MNLHKIRMIERSFRFELAARKLHELPAIGIISEQKVKPFIIIIVVVVAFIGKQ